MATVGVKGFKLLQRGSCPITAQFSYGDFQSVVNHSGSAM